MRYHRTAAGVVLLGAALGLNACSDSVTPTTYTNTLTAVEAQDVGGVVAQDFAELMDASVYDASTGVAMASTPTSGVHTLSSPPACVSVTPSLADQDGDLVPDSARFTFNACTFTRAAVFQDVVNGIVDVVDPVPAVVSLGVRHHFHDFSRTRTNLLLPARSFGVVHNGDREWGGNVDTLGHTITNFVSVWTHPSGRTSTHTKNWAAKFTATTPGSIAVGPGLPEGDWTLNGTSTWATDNRSWSLQATTQTALHFDPSCTESPQLTSGSLLLVVTRNGEITNVQIDFTACGQFTVTRSVPPAV
jgi:hypothetical protein